MERTQFEKLKEEIIELNGRAKELIESGKKLNKRARKIVAKSRVLFK